MARFAAAPAQDIQESPQRTATANFRRAAVNLRLSPEMQATLAAPLREVMLEIPLRMDDGTQQMFTAYRVQHNDARGPASGGLRFQSSSDLDEVRALAATHTWKAALLNLPFGGAQGAIACDPARLSRQERERLTRNYVSRLRPLLGQYRDVPSPDVNADSEVMGWICDQYSELNRPAFACVTGKPQSMGGSCGSERAVGVGIACVVLEASKHREPRTDALRVAVQGFGKVGHAAAEALAKLGCRVVAISDSRGGIRNNAGVDIAALKEHLSGGASVSNFVGGEKITNTDLLETDCDVLVLAATDSVVTGNNASRIRAPLIVEGANLAITPSADIILERLGVMVVPDILANGGAVASSYFEWTQNLEQVYWRAEQVTSELEKVMTRAYGAVLARARVDKTSLRVAAYSLGMERVARVEKLRAA